MATKKKVPTIAWVIFGIVISIIVGSLIFEPEYTLTQGYIIAGVFMVIIAYVFAYIKGFRIQNLFKKKE